MVDEVSKMLLIGHEVPRRLRWRIIGDLVVTHLLIHKLVMHL